MVKLDPISEEKNLSRDERRLLTRVQQLGVSDESLRELKQILYGKARRFYFASDEDERRIRYLAKQEKVTLPE